MKNFINVYLMRLLLMLKNKSDLKHLKMPQLMNIKHILILKVYFLCTKNKNNSEHVV